MQHSPLEAQAAQSLGDKSIDNFPQHNSEAKTASAVELQLPCQILQLPCQSDSVVVPVTVRTHGGLQSKHHLFTYSLGVCPRCPKRRCAS